MTTHILVLCTHNSARSILAEAMLNHWAQLLGQDVRAHSAGAAPSGRVHPQALTVLQAAGIQVAGLTSKALSCFTQADAPPLRVVLTVCDSAAAQACPIFPGAPVQVPWSYPDPSAALPEEQPQRFELTRQALGYRMLQLLALPMAQLDDAALKAALQRIGAA